MPPSLEIRDSRYTLEFTCAEAVPFRAGYLTDLYDQLDAWHAALPLATVVWETLAPVGAMAVYELKGVAADGRVWQITVGLTPGIEEAVYTFAVTDRFTAAEFMPQRLLRDTLILLTLNYQVSRIEVTWL